MWSTNLEFLKVALELQQKNPHTMLKFITWMCNTLLYECKTNHFIFSRPTWWSVKRESWNFLCSQFQTPNKSRAAEMDMAAQRRNFPPFDSNTISWSFLHELRLVSFYDDITKESMIAARRAPVIIVHCCCLSK